MKTVQQLAELNAIMLRDAEANPSAPLTDNAEEIKLRFDAALAVLVARIQTESDAYYAKSFPSLSPPRFTVAPSKKGQRFVKIVENGRRIVGFIELGTGFMWKSAGRAPALNFPRGCIFDLDKIPEGELKRGTFDVLTTKVDLG